VVDAYRIVVMEQGRVVEQGSHPELLALNGRYARMWQLQQSGHGETAANHEHQVA
jgi:ATP-binding cassette subfamily B protein